MYIKHQTCLQYAKNGEQSKNNQALDIPEQPLDRTIPHLLSLQSQ